MKKTTITIATLSLILTLIATAVGQDRRRVPPPKGMNKADLTEQLSIQSNRQRGRRPNAVGNPFGLGGTVTAGVKNRKPVNLGDTGTHEVGHKTKRRTAQYNPKEIGVDKVQTLGDTATHEVISKQPNAAKYDGIDGESNDARTRNPNGRRKTQNLLPYVEQDNLKTTKSRGNQRDSLAELGEEQQLRKNRRKPRN